MKDRRPDILALMLAVFIGAAFFRQSVQTAEDLVESCERGNLIRLEVSERAEPIRRTIDVLIQARDRDGSIVASSSDPKVRRVAIKEAQRLRHIKSEVGTIEQVDCDEAVRKPWPL